MMLLHSGGHRILPFLSTSLSMRNLNRDSDGRKKKAQAGGKEAKPAQAYNWGMGTGFIGERNLDVNKKFLFLIPGNGWRG
jgi:hypothetical protein